MDQYYNDEYNYSNSDPTAGFRLEPEDLPRYKGKPHPKQPKNTKHVKFLDQANGHVMGANGHMMGANGQPMMGAIGQPMTGANGQPMMGANGQPMMGANGQPMTHANGQPMMGANGQPMTNANGQQMTGANGQPMMGANGQQIVGSGANGLSSVVFPLLSYSQQCSLNPQSQVKISDPSWIIILLVIIAVLLIVISIQLAFSSSKKYNWALPSGNPPFNLVRL